MEKINKKDICNRVADQTGFAQHKTYQIISVFMEEIMDAVAAGDEVVLAGFMKFSKKDMPPRKGRNPHTGEPVDIAETARVFAKPGAVFKDRVKGKK